MITASLHVRTRAIILVGLLGIFSLIVQKPIAATEFYLPIPTQTRIEQMEDFRGAFLQSRDGVLQIDEVVWQIHADGTLDIGEFKGFNDKGEWIEVSRVADDARIVSTLADFHDFYLGAPDDPELVWVERVMFATDSQGFLRIIELYGRKVSTNSEIDYVLSLGDPCGLRVETWCDRHTCVGDCGTYPACPCDAAGDCKGIMTSICSGDCPTGWICNGSVEDCKCVIDVPSLSQWGLIALMLVFLAIATWVFFWRRRIVRNKIT